jgi:hypothetical protein
MGSLALQVCHSKHEGNPHATGASLSQRTIFLLFLVTVVHEAFPMSRTPAGLTWDTM